MRFVSSAEEKRIKKIKMYSRINETCLKSVCANQRNNHSRSDRKWVNLKHFFLPLWENIAAGGSSSEAQGADCWHPLVQTKQQGRKCEAFLVFRSWGAGYVELCGSWLCFKTIPHWSHSQQLLVAKRKRERWNAFLPLFSAVQRCRACLLLSPSHYFWAKQPPRRVKRKKKDAFPLQSKAADPNAGKTKQKKNKTKKSRGRFLFIRLVSGDYLSSLQPFAVQMLTWERHTGVNI